MFADFEQPPALPGSAKYLFDDGTFICYHFPDDPNAFVLPYGPHQGKREPSFFKVFLCPDR